MGRLLAVHAVGPHVRHEVLVELLDGEREQCALLVERRQRERDDQQRVELERAVIALGREVLADVGGVLADPLQQLAVESRAQAGEAGRRRERGPGVDPVLHPPRGDVRGVLDALARRDLAQVGADQPLPGVEEALLAGLGVGVREVEAEVELRPLDAPLAVLGQLGADPVGLDADVDRLARVREAPAAGVLGDRAAAVGVRDDAEHRPRGDPVLIGERGRGAHAITSRNSVCSVPASRSPSSSRSTVARAAAEIRPASSVSSRRRTTASATAVASSGATSSPFSPSRTISGMPEIGVVTTGAPAAMASASTFGMPSRSPLSRIRHGRQNADARRYSSYSSAWLIWPSSRMRSPSPSSAMRARSFGPASSSGPTITASNGTPRRSSSPQASTTTSKPFFSTRRPTPSRRTASRRAPFVVPLGPGAAAALSSPISLEKSAFSPW